MRRSVPASTARDALTHTTGKNGASGATHGKRADAGVIHSGRSGLSGSAGRAYDESCVRVRARTRRGKQLEGGGVKKGKGGGGTYCECRGPAVEPCSDLGVLVGADCPGRRMQVKKIRRRRRRRDARRRCLEGAAATAQACGAVDDGAPDRHGLGEGVGEALACARRIYENNSGTKISKINKISGRVVMTATHPPWVAATDSRCMFGRRRLKAQFP